MDALLSLLSSSWSLAAAVDLFVYKSVVDPLLLEVVMIFVFDERFWLVKVGLYPEDVRVNGIDVIVVWLPIVIVVKPGWVDSV